MTLRKLSHYEIREELSRELGIGLETDAAALL